MASKLIDQLLNSHGRSILSFLTVGALSATIQFTSFSLFWGFFKLNDQAAISIAYFLSILFHFSANRRFTFKSHNAQFIPQITKYIIMVIINYFITLAVMYYIVRILGLSPYVGTVSAIATTVGISYLLARFWVFHSKHLDIVQGG